MKPWLATVVTAEFTACRDGKRDSLRKNLSMCFKNPRARVVRRKVTLVTRLFVVAVCCWGTLATADAAPGKSPPGYGNIELTVRGPDGTPLRQSLMEMSPTETFPPRDAPPSMQVKTDEQGQVRFEWPTGMHRIRVVAAGVGYGATGSFELQEFAVVRLSVPPLLPFARIEGDIPKKFVRAGVQILIPFDLRTDTTFPKSTITCNEDGHFVLGDVPCGGYSLRPRTNIGPLGINAYVFVAPGERRAQVHFQSEQASVPQAGSTFSTIPEASGTVRDPQGRPIVGADVFMLGRYEGIRMNETILAVKSDAQGRWKIADNEARWLFSGSLVAHKPGYAFSVTPLRSPERSTSAASKTPGHTGYELVLSPTSGFVAVTVVRDGVAVKNAPVQVLGEVAPRLASPAYIGASREAARDALAAIIEPVVLTDEQGIARFVDLPPDRYQLLATNTDPRTLIYIRDQFGQGEQVFGIARDVAIQAGRTTKFALAIYPQVYERRFQLRLPDGEPSRPSSAIQEWGRVFESGRTSSMPLDPQGTGTHRFSGPGLWRFGMKYREPPAKSISLTMAPYYQAIGVVGVSALLGPSDVTTLNAERIHPGTLDVQLEDVDGAPTPGFVLLNRFEVWAQHAGSTDEVGRLRFDDLQAGQFRIEVYSHRRALPSLGYGDSPFPDDQTLIGHTTYPNHNLTLVNNVVTPIKFRAVPVGYVRGVVRPPAGRSCADYYFENRFPFQVPWCRYDSKTGAFVCGPLPLGKTRIVLRRFGEPTEVIYADQEVEVLQDRVTHIELTPPATRDAGDPRRKPSFLASMNPGSLSGNVVYANCVLGGEVTAADGHTPAGGAQVHTFFPPSPSPTRHTVAAADGRFHLSDVPYAPDDPDQEQIGSQAEPIILAFIPGTTGAAIVPLTKDRVAKALSIALPHPITLSGKVTVGGKSIAGRNQLFRVLAEYQSRSDLNGFLDVRATADAEGNFELTGLTPGTYLVQAAMDDIWVSQTETVVVPDKATPPLPLHFDLAMPGGRSIVRCVDHDGNPAIGVKAALRRPSGPLSEQLWPKELVADGAGIIHVPPLEAGVHTLQIAGQTTEERLAIPAISEAGDMPNRFDVQLR